MARLQELLRYRELIYNLTLRDIRLKYKRSTLGVAWSLLNPLFMMAIYTAVFSVFLRAVKVPNYWALVLGGLLAWTFFAGALGSATTSFAHSANLISKVYFPIETLPIAGVAANFVNFTISLAALLVILVVARVHLGVSIVLLPVLMLAQLALAIGLGMLVATLTVYFRDLEHLVALGLTALFYVSPVLYPLDPHALPAGASKYIAYLNLNPLSWYLESYHAVLFYGRWPEPGQLVGVGASALVALAFGYAVFLRFKSQLPEEV